MKAVKPLKLSDKITIIEPRDKNYGPMKGIFKKVSIITLIIAVLFHMLHYGLAAFGKLTELEARQAETALDKFDYIALAIMFACLGGKLTGKAADMIKMLKKKEPAGPP